MSHATEESPVSVEGDEAESPAGNSISGRARDKRQDESKKKDCYDAVASLKATRTVTFLRFTVMILLLTTAVVVCVGVFIYTRRNEEDKYEQEYDDAATKMIESFHLTVHRKLGAINSLANQITAYALETNSSFPFVTVPNFAVRGSDLRILADSVIVHYMPLVTNDNRGEWEDYAMENRFHIDEAFKQDKDLRQRQDVEFGFSLDAKGNGRLLDENTAIDASWFETEYGYELNQKEEGRLLEETSPVDPSLFVNETILKDGTGYHPKIYSIGSVLPRADFPENTGPHLPLWQRSPISGARQRLINMDFSATFAIGRQISGILQETNQVVMNKAVFPIPTALKNFKSNLAVGQFRHDGDFAVESPLTFIISPVFDSFERDRQFAGALATQIYWELFLEKVLQPSSTPLICVLGNSWNQTFSYLVEGPEVSYLGQIDAHDRQYDYLEHFADVNAYVSALSGPETRSYTSVPLNREYGQYTLRIYPYEGPNHTNDPIIYSLVVASVFVFTSAVFILFTIVVEKRQKLVMDAALMHERKAATTAQELNEFLSHEVRNPLSAAISASSFVNTAIKESADITNDEFRESLIDDVRIVTSSLSFINDFLRSMLTIAAGKKLKINLAPTDIKTDVLEAVSHMFYQKDTTVSIEVACPEGIFMMTDCLRIKQVILNLGRNSAKFVEHGFIRFSAKKMTESIEISVEDSGPGIPAEKRAELFSKFQASLDVLGQGTGLGLSLCKNLVDLLGGEIFLDENYDSGVKDCPGARFVVRFDRTSTEVTGEISDHTESDSLPDLVVRDSKRHILALAEDLDVLFVDDDLMLRKLFSRGIRRAAPTWKISEAASGESALGLVDSNKFDLIFMDQYMAGADKQLLGTEAVRALRAKGVESIICGLSANNLEESFLAAGADYFIMKPMPCEKEELICELLRVTKRLAVKIIDVDASTED